MSALSALAAELRRNSEAWFPAVHARKPAEIRVHYALGLAGEVGEAINIVKKANRDDGRPFADDLAPELADVFAYLLLLADHEGIDLEAALAAKRQVLADRWGAVQ